MRTIAFLLLSALILFACGADQNNAGLNGVKNQIQGGEVGDDDSSEADHNGDPGEIPPGALPELPKYLSDRPWLQNRSVWSGKIDLDQGFRFRKIGGFGVGNGKVWALIGPTSPLNLIHNMIGPDYQKGSRFFADKWLVLSTEDGNLYPKIQEDFRVRKTSIVITRTIAYPLEMHTIDFAPRLSHGKYADDIRAEDALIRIVVIRNVGIEITHKPAVSLASMWGKFKDSRYLEDTDIKSLTIAALGETLESTMMGFKIPFSDLLPGEEYVVPLVFAFTQTGDSPDPIIEAVNNAGTDNLLEATKEWWENWTAQGTAIETPYESVNDYFEGVGITIKNQQAQTGAICAMSEYTSTWLRDTIGSVKFFAATGRIQDALDMVDYIWWASCSQGGIHNAMPANLTFDSPPPEPDWGSMGQMSGRTAAESPSYITLQYKELADVTGDLSRIEERWGMLRHSIVDQEYINGCLQPFSTDETYRINMQIGFGYNLLTEIGDDYISANSSFLSTAAAEILASWAEQLGKPGEHDELMQLANNVRSCAEDLYWIEPQGYWAAIASKDDFQVVARPFEDVSTQPLWTGYIKPDDPKALQNIQSLIDLIGMPDGTIQTPMASFYRGLMDVWEGVFTGMTPGYWLDNLTKTDHPNAQKCFETVLDILTESGNLNEDHNRDDFGRLWLLYDPLGFVCDISARYRAWEGGIVGRAMLDFLAGVSPNASQGELTLEPHLPNGWDRIAIARLPFGKGSYDLTVERISNGIQATVTPHNVSFRIKVKLNSESPNVTASLNNILLSTDSFEVISRFDHYQIRFSPKVIMSELKFTVSWK